jgi:hypothetical protein
LIQQAAGYLQYTEPVERNNSGAPSPFTPFFAQQKDRLFIMFLSKTSLAFLAMTHGLVAGTPMPQSDGEFDGTRPKPGIECDGLIQPSYKDCTAPYS